MDKLVGYVIKTPEVDNSETWFKLLVVEDGKAEQTKTFDCRIYHDTTISGVPHENTVDTIKNHLTIGRYVELGGFMMLDYVERGVMSIWFSVWDVSVGASEEMVTILKSRPKE